MKSIPLTILAYEGPQVRAYLSRMRLMDLMPECILLLVMKHHPGNKKSLGKWLPMNLRIRYAEKVQALTNNYWPIKIKNTYPFLVELIADNLTKSIDFAQDSINEIIGKFHYEDYSKKVDRLFISNLSDDGIMGKLRNLSPMTVLFTGGGILRSNLLNIPGIKFIHIHPGYLPYVRGADGLLWSIITRNKLGMSAFYMVEDIDVGNIISRHEYEWLSIDLNKNLRPSDKVLYQSIFSYFDPLLRADYFTQNIASKDNDLLALASTIQKGNDGVTYHFMHKNMLNKALKKLFTNSRPE